MLGLQATKGPLGAIRRALGSRKQLPIGIDIGGESIKMLQLEQTAPETVSVCAAAIWRFPRGSSEDPSQRRQQAVEAVHKMLRENGFRGNDVVTAMPRGKVDIRNVRLPQMPPKELRDAVKWEAKERFSFELSDDQFGYINAGEVRRGDETCQEVILLAADKQAVEEHASLLSAMKLNPIHIEAAPLAAFRTFDRYHRRQDDEQVSAVVVEIGASGTDIVVAKGRQVVFLKSLEIGGTALTAAVAKQLNLSEADAWQLRQRRIRQQSSPSPQNSSQRGGEGESSQPDWNTQDALRGALESLGEELALCMRYCSVTFRGFRPPQVILCGGEAHDPFVAKTLGERLGMQCVAGQPLQGFNTSGVTMDNEGRGIFPEWAVCAGLAVRCLAEPTASEGKNGEHRLSA